MNKILISITTSLLLSVNLYSENNIIPKIDFNSLANLNISNEEIELLEDYKFFDQKNKLKETISLKDLIVYRISQNKKILSLKMDVQKSKYELEKRYNVFFPTIDFELDRSYSKNNDFVTQQQDLQYQENTSTYTRFEVDLNLYNGGLDNLNIQSALKDLKMKELLLNEEINNQIFEIIKVYVNLVYIEKKINISNKTLKKLEKLVKITKTKYKAGAVSTGDLNSIKALYYKNKIQNIDFKNQYNDLLNLYEFLVGEELKNKVPREENYNVSIEPLLKLKEKIVNNNTYVLYNVEQDINRLKIKMNKAKFKPTLDLELKLENRVMDTKNTNLQGTDTSNYTALFKFQYNLFNKTNDLTEYKKNLLNIRQNSYKMSYLKEELNYKVSKLFLDMNAIIDSTDNKFEEKDNLEQMLKNYWVLYLNGKQNINNIIQGEKDLLNSKIDLLDLEQKKIIDFFEIKLITNELVKYFKYDTNNTYNIVKEEINKPTIVNKLNYDTKDNVVEKIEYIIHKRTKKDNIKKLKPNEIKNTEKLKIINKLKEIEEEYKKRKEEELKKLEEFTDGE